MPIPELNQDGLLPEGIHEASLEEVRERFGRFQRTDRRPGLFARLTEFLQAARSTGLVVAVIIDGSFATAKDEPSDIDLILVLDPQHDYGADLKPFQYNVFSKRRVRSQFRFDVLDGPEGSARLQEYVTLFRRVKERPDLQKGVLKVVL